MELITTRFQVNAAQHFANAVSVDGNSFYVFASHPLPWSDDLNPPDVSDSYNNVQFASYDTMIMGKQVTTNDIVLMASRNNWVANTVYPFYDDQNANLFDPDNAYFVVINANTSYDVFECLNNNGGAVSTVQPQRQFTSEDDVFYFTSDGYQWKYLYSITPTQFTKFATSTKIPLIPNANVTANAVPGAIDTILVVSGGVGYNSYANGFFQEIAVGGDNLLFTIDPSSSSNADFYTSCALKIVAGQGAGQQKTITNYIVAGGFKRVVVDSTFDTIPDLTSAYEITPSVVVVGDGSGLIARAIVNATSNTIQSIEVSARGTGFSWATATIVGNTGIASVGNTFITTPASARVIIGPAEGHGGDIYNELAATTVGVSVTFANTESGTIPATGAFRQVGLLNSPLFANVILGLSSVVGSFSSSETIVDASNAVIGISTAFNGGMETLQLTNCNSNVGPNTSIIGLSSNATATVSTLTISGQSKTFLTFDQRTRMNVSFSNSSIFQAGDQITDTDTNANGYVQFANSTFVAITQVREPLFAGDTISTNTASANVSSVTLPDLVKTSGDVLYINNIQPVTRGSTLSETVQISIDF